MISVTEIDAWIKKQLWSFFSTEAHKEPDRVRYINSAVRAIATAKNFSFNRYKLDVTTVSWTTDYSIPFQIETFWVLDSDWLEVEILDFDDYYIQKATLTNTPIIGIWDETLVTDLVGTYTILYRGYPPTITSITGTIALPEHFYDLVVTKAVAFWFADIKDYVKEAQKESIFNGMIKSMATRNSNRKPRNINMVWANDIGW